MVVLDRLAATSLFMCTFFIYKSYKIIYFFRILCTLFTLVQTGSVSCHCIITCIVLPLFQTRVYDHRSFI